VALLFPLSACGDFSGGGKWHNNMTCTGSPLGKNCQMTEGEYLGLKIGMTKEDAFQSACQGEANRYLLNPTFQGKDPDDWVGRLGKVTCDLKSAAMRTDMWVFGKAEDLYGGGVVVKFTNNKIVKILYSYSLIAI
jgi:hypothetical protein